MYCHISSNQITIINHILTLCQSQYNRFQIVCISIILRLHIDCNTIDCRLFMYQSIVLRFSIVNILSYTNGCYINCNTTVCISINCVSIDRQFIVYQWIVCHHISTVQPSTISIKLKYSQYYLIGMQSIFILLLYCLFLESMQVQ